MPKHDAKKKNQKIALDHINTLMHEAKETFSKDKQLANRYVEIARKIAMKFNIRFPGELKKQFCRHCYSYLVPGINCRIRTHEGHVVYYCTDCKKYSRHPYLKEQKEKRKATLKATTKTSSQ